MASMLAHYDTKNPDAMLRLVASGVQISACPPDVIETIYAASQEHDAGLISSNEAFAKSTRRRRNLETKITSIIAPPTISTIRPCGASPSYHS
jgi:TRAP-type mannitol/chloroaromatic compound transport system substrate-binding protein